MGTTNNIAIFGIRNVYFSLVEINRFTRDESIISKLFN